MKCENCGAESTTKYCPYCGSEMPYNGPNTVINNQQTIINNYYTEKPINNISRNTANKRVYYSNKRKSWALVLCIFLGMCGAHYFYVGKVGKGILYLFTGGLFGIGWIVDIFRIISGGFTDSKGYSLDDTPMNPKEKNSIFLGLTILGVIGLIVGISSLEKELIVFYLIWSGIFGFLYYLGLKKIDSGDSYNE